MLRLMSSMHKKETRSWAEEAEQGCRKKESKNGSLANGGEGSCMPMVALLFPPRAKAGEWSKITRSTSEDFL